MNQKTIGIQKILWHSDLSIEDTNFDVLIPLPANHDECLKSIGITDFNDSDEQWDKDFLIILNKLVNENNCNIEIYDPRSKEIDKKISLKISDIPLFLSQADHLNIRITYKNKKIIFTNGHEIFWTTGFSHLEIESLGYKIVKIENKKLNEIY